jgi:glutaconate CoA-transferase subunit A
MTKGKPLTPQSKLMTMRETIARFVTDGSTVVMGTGLETGIPFAAGHEIIRQGVRDLTLVGPISDILFDQLIGAGCVRRVRAAWVGNVSTGSGYNFRRAVESGRLEVEDHSNLTIALGLLAGALGVPFMPTRTALGSDLLATNPSLRDTRCPFTGQRLAAVAAITPDVAIVQVQRSDEHGNAHLWGNLGVSHEACQASRHVILVAEEIVPTEVIASDPNRTLLPSFQVSAVVHEPWGAHPSPLAGCYDRDHQFYLDYAQESRDPDAFARWLEHWVMGVDGREGYCRLLGEERLARLRPGISAPAAPVDYGY